MVSGKTISSVFKDLPDIETDRLLLRKIRISDVEDLFQYCSDPEVSRYVTWDYHRNISDTRNFVMQALEHCEKGEVRGWFFEYKDTGRVIGSGGFHWWNPLHHSGEIGYVLSRLYWNKGLMTEAVMKMIEFGFTKMELNRIVAHCMIGNDASVRVLEKCGMKFEGILREHMFVKNEYRTVKVYSILRKEWQCS